MGVGQKSLTDPPTNLKDAIDWLALVGGGFGSKSWDGSRKYIGLDDKIRSIPEWNAALEKSGVSVALQGLIKKLAETLGYGFLGYEGSESFDHNKGIIKSDNGYTSAYKTAQWEDGEANDYAKVFLCASVTVYYGVTYLYWKCSNRQTYGGWATYWLNVSGSDPLSLFMLQMGFTSAELQHKNGTQVANILKGFHSGFSELQSAKTNQHSYSTFLSEFEEQNASKSGINHPLTCCVKLANAYFASQFQKGDQTDETLINIKKAFEEFSKLYFWRRLCPTPRNLKHSHPNPPPPAPSPAPSPPLAWAAELRQPTYSTSEAPRPLSMGFLELANLHSYHLSFLVDLSFWLPSNLKEAIDWILRVTGKDGGSQDKSNDLANAVVGLQDFKQAIDVAAKKLKESGSEVSTVSQALKKLKDEANLREIIKKLADGLGDFIGYQGNDGTIGHIIGIAMRPQENKGKPHESRDKAKDHYGYYQKGYIWSYSKSATWQTQWNTPSHADAKTCAMIFLSCVPLYFYGISFFYWKCQKPQKDGGWSDQNCNGGDYDIRYFLSGQGFGRDELSSQTGEKVLGTAFNKLTEFSGAIAGSNSFAEYVQTLYKQFYDTIKQDASVTAEKLKEHCIPALFLASSTYFKHKRSTNPNTSPNPPTSIRTMLYWLSGLMITPQLCELLEHFATVVPTGFKIAVSGKVGGSSLILLSADDLVGHLVRVCLSCSNVLAAIQGTGGSDNPLLHDVFMNTENLQYPSISSAVLRNISDYTYALQFQLGFLFRQCRFACAEAGGWEKCTYGNGVSDDNLQSHLCNNHSPCALQAFLTDKLPGFSRTTPGSISAHLAECSGSMCHVPMGFNGHLKGEQKNGEYIYDTLAYFCGDSKDSLNQLCDKLSCLTKRTPRSLGDMFGFYSQLLGQLFKKRPEDWNLGGGLDLSDDLQRYTSDPYPALSSVKGKMVEYTPSQPNKSGIIQSLLSISSVLPFWENIFIVESKRSLPYTLYDLTVAEHSKPSHLANFSSISQSVFNDDKGCLNRACGGYFRPLSFSIGSTFAPSYASTYLSWVLYLADDLQSWFQDMLDEFKDSKCTHSLQTHSESGCHCDSVVSCNGVLPLLYANGFQFASASLLSGNYESKGKRQCSHFSTALSSVVANSESTPLFKLLTTIDTFLYAIRWEFFSKLSGFWTIYMCLILYTFFFLLDTLHIRSHLKLTSSPIVPPLALLTSGKPLLVTKLTYITQ
ncbi:variant erythrocyte surface antigen-1 family protein [Babesia caballi]|uniref:Variant erythrocyte surface antigen-1 family protein n=1 Tax=Babesia caballi TaxID=5871 RepID=A0AAV4M0W5_BABCB|nr:variant erythrocyte surface antigen-1 family protein [Babesia caballi]